MVSRERPQGARASPRTAPARAARVQAGRTAPGPPAPRSTSTTTVLLLKADCPSRPEVLIINGALAGRETDVPRLGGHKGTGRGGGRDVLPRITPRGPALHATMDEE